MTNAVLSKFMWYLQSMTLYLTTHYQSSLPWLTPDIQLYWIQLGLELHFCLLLLFLACLSVTDSSLIPGYVLSTWLYNECMITSYQSGLPDTTLGLSQYASVISSLQSLSLHSCLHTCSRSQPVVQPITCPQFLCSNLLLQSMTWSSCSSLQYIIYCGGVTQCWLVQTLLSTRNICWQGLWGTHDTLCPHATYCICSSSELEVHEMLSSP